MSCKCVFRAIEVEECNGVTTITVENNKLVNLCDNEIFYISLDTSIPNTARCNRIIVTDGALSLDLLKNNQYFRIEKLPCNCTLVACKKADPSIAVFCRFTATKKECI